MLIHYMGNTLYLYRKIFYVTDILDHKILLYNYYNENISKKLTK